MSENRKHANGIPNYQIIYLKISGVLQVNTLGESGSADQSSSGIPTLNVNNKQRGFVHLMRFKDRSLPKPYQYMVK